MPAPHHSSFYGLDALPAFNQQRQSTEGINVMINTGKTAMLSCQQFTESVYSYSLLNAIDSAWTVSGNITLRCEVIMFCLLYTSDAADE